MTIHRSKGKEKNKQISPYPRIKFSLHNSERAKAKLNVILKIVLPCNTRTEIFETIVPLRTDRGRTVKAEKLSVRNLVSRTEPRISIGGQKVQSSRPSDKSMFVIGQSVIAWDSVKINTVQRPPRVLNDEFMHIGM